MHQLEPISPIAGIATVALPLPPIIVQCTVQGRRHSWHCHQLTLSMLQLSMLQYVLVYHTNRPEPFTLNYDLEFQFHVTYGQDAYTHAKN